MSKTFRAFLQIFATSVLFLQFFTNAQAQDIEAKIKLGPQAASIVSISGKNSRKRKNLSFLLSTAGVDKLGERISDVNLFDGEGKTVTYRKFIAGEYVADADFTSWSYKIDLTPPRNQTAAAHVSWISGEMGLLMLGDLLPQMGRERTQARITLQLPEGWCAIYRGDVRRPEIGVPDVDKTVFLIGKGWRDEEIGDKDRPFVLMMSGDWQFTEREARDQINEIRLEYGKLFGWPADRGIQIAISKFPGNVPTGNWEADTRGNNITILSSDMPFKSQSLQRLHEQLRHEIFHLWIPNGVNLTGNYDWFYEGFALYQSLKIGVAVNRIRFDDFLDTLSRAYDIDSFQAQKLSLIAASKNRWAGANTQVYARGMLVAFLCDLALLDKSKGKHSIAEILRKIYEKHRPPNPAQDGNSAVLALLRTNAELVPIIDRNITKAESIDWAGLLNAAGLEAESKDQLTKLKVTAKPSGSQKKLLDKLGYNSWRKLSESNR